MSLEAWSLRISYILFAESSKQKSTQIFSIWKHLFSSWFNFRKNCAYI